LPILSVREFLERLAGLPHIDDSDAIVGLRHPMEQLGARRRPAGQEAQSFGRFVVLLERAAFEIELHRNSHRTPPSRGRRPILRVKTRA